MDREKKEKQKKRRAGENTAAAQESAAGSPARPGRPELAHLSGEWLEFYRLVTERIALRLERLSGTGKADRPDRRPEAADRGGAGRPKRIQRK
ncbi:MAG: hypothetical protein K6T80_07235 [Firmicutes bacterium]|nr:hypothetical protein [Bacillota bacterium]